MINVIGLGYIGLPTALMLASNGIDVVGTDSNVEIILQLNAGKTMFHEKGFDDLFSIAYNAGITFTNEYQNADTYIIAVPTPYDKNSKKIDASFVINAVKNVLEVCQEGSIIIIESTMAPGTIDRFVRPLINKKIHLVHAPERIIPGNMIFELKHNNRTIGSDDPAIGEKVKNIYASFCHGDIEVTDIRTAEMTKVVENAFRDINIAYANELAKICQSGGMDVYEIIRIANKHPRVNILNPGPGVGGHCISVDPWFLVGDYPGLANIILAARKINDSMPEFVLERIYNIMQENKLKDVSRVGLYGLTYKENVDDVRESPTLQMLDFMRKHLAFGVKVYDPLVKCDIVENQYHELDNFLAAVDVVVIMVAHDEIVQNGHKFQNKIVLDTRNIYNYKGTYKL